MLFLQINFYSVLRIIKCKREEIPKYENVKTKYLGIF